ALGEPVIIGLPVESFSVSESSVRDISAILQGIWHRVIGNGANLTSLSFDSDDIQTADASAFIRSWKDLLGVEIPISELFSTRLLNDKFSSGGPELTRQLVKTGTTLLDYNEQRLTLEVLSRFISECNYRS